MERKPVKVTRWLLAFDSQMLGLRLKSAPDKPRPSFEIDAAIRARITSSEPSPSGTRAKRGGTPCVVARLSAEPAVAAKNSARVASEAILVGS